MPDDIDWFVAGTYLNPDWSNKTKVHDWRNYVGERTQSLWESLPDNVKLAIALDAQELADWEDWG
jgi:hypothetical protein